MKAGSALPPGIVGLLVGFAAGFLIYASDMAAAIASIGLVAAGLLLGICNRHWIAEIFSLIPAMVAGALCGLTTIVWKRDPTAHNLWPLELVMFSVVITVLLLLFGGGGALIRRYVLHSPVEPDAPVSMSAYFIPLATIAGTIGYILLRGAMMDAK